MTERILWELRAASGLFWMLWHHGSFPLRIVVPAMASSFMVGWLVGLVS